MKKITNNAEQAKRFDLQVSGHFHGQWPKLLPFTPGYRAPDPLDGSDAVNRHDQIALIDARDDMQAMNAWLNNFRTSPSTLRAYTKELQRLVLWSHYERFRAVSGLGADDLLAFFAFLASPPAHWVNPSPVPSESSDWRPLRGPLKESSVRQAKTIINAMFTWLVANRYLSGNPCALVRTRRVSASKRVERYVRRQEWEYLQMWVAALPSDNLRNTRVKARTKHLLALLYLTAARLSDVSSARMGDIQQRDDGTWWWRVVGKGQKEADIPVTQELLDSIKAYRRFYNLTALPSPSDPMPLVMRLGGPETGNALLTDSMVYKCIKGMFEGASRSAESDGNVEIAAGLARASTHWLRHTSLTHQVEAGIPLPVVRDNARHASIATTSRYLWTEDKERHAQTEKLRML